MGPRRVEWAAHPLPQGWYNLMGPTRSVCRQKNTREAPRYADAKSGEPTKSIRRYERVSWIR